MMIHYNYNGNIYTVDPNSSIKACLDREDLVSLPMSEWINLLKLKCGTVEGYILRQILMAKIKLYDNSSNVNSFIYKGQSYWFDKNTRIGLMNLVNCSSDDIDLVLGDLIINMSAMLLKAILIELEQYAGKCFANTAKHIKAIKDLRTIDDMLNYDYTEGYPEKVIIK